MIDRRYRNSNRHRGEVRRAGPIKIVFLTVLWFFLVIVLMAAASVGGALSFYGMMVFRARTETVKLENLTGLSSLEATRRLKEVGLHVEVVGEHGTVIRMDPLPGTVVKVGRKVRLYTEKVRMKYMFLPDLTGAWYKTVQAILRDVGIKYTISEVDEPVFKGVVLWTVPTAGAKLASGDLVRLSISTGRKAPQPEVPEEEVSVAPESTPSTSEGIPVSTGGPGDEIYWPIQPESEQPPKQPSEPFEPHETTTPPPVYGEPRVMPLPPSQQALPPSQQGSSPQDESPVEGPHLPGEPPEHEQKPEGGQF